MRKLNNSEVRRREAQFRATLYSIGDAVIATDRHGRVEMMNPIAERLTGWSEAEARGKPLEAVFHVINEETRQPVANPVARVPSEGIVVSLANHTLLISRDGREYAITGAGAPIFDVDNNICGVVLVFRDQTAERATQRALQEARRFAESIVETIREPLLVLNETLEVVSANRSFCRMFCVQPEQIIGRKVYELGNRQWDIPCLRELLEDILPSNAHFDDFEVENTFEHIGRRTLLLNARRLLRSQGSPEFILLAIEDVTDRQQTEHSLRQSEERYRHISRLISDYAYAFRVESNNLLIREWMTESFADITGYTPLELDERGGWQSLIHPDDVPIALQREKRLLAGHNDVSEFRIVRKDGTLRWLRDHATPLVDPVLKRVVRIFGAAQDVTERRQTEEALKLSHQRYEQLVNSLDGIVWEADASTFQFLFVSKQAERLLGYPLEDWTSSPSFWKDHLHPEDASWAVEHCRQATNEMRAHQLEYRMIAADGRVVWLRDNVVVIAREGKPYLLRGILVDITEQKHAERILSDYTKVLELVAAGAPLQQTLETLAQQIEEQAPGMLASVLLLDRDGVHLRHGAAPSLPKEYNKLVDGIAIGEGVGSCGTAVWRRQQVIGEDIATDPLWKDYREVAARFNLRACWSTPIFGQEGNVLGTFALYYPKPAAPNPKHREIIQRATHLAAIVLERHRKEESLRESEERYRTLYQENPSMFFTLAADGTIVSANTFGAQYLGCTPEELLGTSVLNVFHPDDRESLTMHIRDCLTTPGQSYRWQLRKIRRDGSLVWVEEFARAVPEPGGGHHVLVVCNDITERKQAEERRLQLEQQLLQSQKLESLGTLASGVAHDFNNILGIILAHASVLESLVGQSDNGAKHLDAINKASQRGAALVRQLLTFARKTESVFEPLDLNDVVLEVTRLLKETFPKSISVVTDLEPGLPVITADATQIHQVIVNLSVNARDAMPKGGTLMLRTRRFPARELIARHAQAPLRDYVMLEARDSGIGMDEATRRRIFEPFFTTKGVGKGTGLGLALVHGIVEAHGGYIDVESSPHRGTTFRIVIPIAEEQPAAQTASLNEAEKIPGGTETLLVIEDEEMLRELVQAILEAKGYRVLTAEDGRKGVELYRAHQKEIAAVITDMGLPLMSGEEVFTTIRSLNPDARVILVSGYVEPEVKTDLMGRGANEFIQKPYTMSEILLKTRKVLDT